MNGSLSNESVEPEIMKLWVLNQHYLMPSKNIIGSQFVGLIHYTNISYLNTSNVCKETGLNEVALIEYLRFEFIYN